MEPEDTSHHHHHHHSLTSYFSSPTAAAPPPPSSAAANSQNNGAMPPPPPPNGGGPESASAAAYHMVYPHSVGPSAAPADPVRRKRGRPRKYVTPEQALAAKRTAAASSASRDKASLSFSGFNKKSNHYMGTPGNTGQAFAPHIIYVGPGEDVALKTNMFMQQSKSETCVMSASGVISSATVRQAATSGGSLTYEGRFDIITLSGSYLRTELGGRTGGLSICMSNTDGRIIGGVLSGPLIAAGAVQVIVGTFTLDNKKDAAGNGVRLDASSPSKLPSPVGGSSLSSIGFRSPVESSERNPGRGNEDHMGGSPFMIHNRGMPMAPSRPMQEWRSGLDPRTGTGYDLTGRTGHGGGHRSPENGNYDQLPD